MFNRKFRIMRCPVVAIIFNWAILFYSWEPGSTNQQLKQNAPKYQLKQFVNFMIPYVCAISNTLDRIIISLNICNNSEIFANPPLYVISIVWTRTIIGSNICDISKCSILNLSIYLSIHFYMYMYVCVCINAEVHLLTRMFFKSFI